MSSTRIYIYGYSKNSESVELLTEEIRSQKVRCVRSVAGHGAGPKPGNFVVHWGVSTDIGNFKSYVNSPAAIRIASNKLSTFMRLRSHNVPIPDFTLSMDVARTWSPRSWVVCRTLLCGSGGRGIHLAKTPEEVIPNAKVYVKYIKKDKEYRVHVFKNTVLDVQEKRRRSVTNRGPNYNSYLRNYDNGWVFCRSNIQEPENLRDIAIRAVDSCGLDFGAVDLVHNTKTGKTYVLEINTAPGVEGTTVKQYASAIINEAKKHHGTSI